jgi:hypothetical protein
MDIPKIHPEIILSHMKEVEDTRTLLNFTNDPLIKKLASNYLSMLASKAGNDILEDMLVRATGRATKEIGQKHGADSADGLVEAKPCKGKYSCHISDDTPMSLKRHQDIPFCVIGVATEDGQKIKWVLIVSYRIFDNSRYLAICKNLGVQGAEWPDSLPEDTLSRNILLDNLVKQHKKKTYIRSNPLPIACLASLSRDQYSLWVNPEFKDSVGSVIEKLA